MWCDTCQTYSQCPAWRTETTENGGTYHSVYVADCAKCGARLMDAAPPKAGVTFEEDAKHSKLESDARCCVPDLLHWIDLVLADVPQLGMTASERGAYLIMRGHFPATVVSKDDRQ